MAKIMKPWQKIIEIIFALTNTWRGPKIMAFQTDKNKKKCNSDKADKNIKWHEKHLRSTATAVKRGEAELYIHLPQASLVITGRQGGEGQAIQKQSYGSAIRMCSKSRFGVAQ